MRHLLKLPRNGSSLIPYLNNVLSINPKWSLIQTESLLHCKMKQLTWALNTNWSATFISMLILKTYVMNNDFLSQGKGGRASYLLWYFQVLKPNSNDYFRRQHRRAAHWNRLNLNPLLLLLVIRHSPCTYLTYTYQIMLERSSKIDDFNTKRVKELFIKCHQNWKSTSAGIIIYMDCHT